MSMKGESPRPRTPITPTDIDPSDILAELARFRGQRAVGRSLNWKGARTERRGQPRQISAKRRAAVRMLADTPMANDAKLCPDFEIVSANGSEAEPLSLRLSVGTWLIGFVAGWAAIFYLAVLIWGR